MNIFESIEIHNELNPKIWDKDNHLLPDVSTKLKEIVDYYRLQSQINLQVIDALLVGSNCSYNYTDKSDLDLHIVTNFDNYDLDKEAVSVILNTEKSSFNNNYDITIHGIDVELYVEDVKSNTASNGIYSLYKDKWIKFPSKLDNVPNVDIDREADIWTKILNNVLESNDYNYINSIIDRLYMIRHNSIAVDGEYGKGNQLFKELRNRGLLDKIKEHKRNLVSKDLSLESLKESKQSLTEDTRMQLIGKSRRSQKGNERFNRRQKSRVANTVREFNSIDMNQLFKDNILTVNISVNGETDNYIVRIKFGGILDIIKEKIDRFGKLDLRIIISSLKEAFNREDVLINCTCADFRFRYAAWATTNKINSGDPENRPSNITNSDDSLGSGCKHILLVLNNNSWIIKVASVIWSYINYMEQHYKKMYADIIYPALYGKKYEEPVQLSIDDTDELASDKDDLTDIIDQGSKRTQFKKGNTQGVRFAKKETPDDNQQTLDDLEDNE